MLHTTPVESMTRNPQYLEVGGLGATPWNSVEVCTVVLYASIMKGNKSSQVPCSRDTNMANMASSVLLKPSTKPSLRGWYGVVFVFTVPNSSDSLCTIVLSNYFP